MKKKSVWILLIVAVLAIAGGIYYKNMDHVPDHAENKQIVLEGYQHLDVQMEPFEALTDEEFETALDIRLNEDHLYNEITNRDIQTGDVVRLAFKGYLDNKTHKEDISSHAFDLEIGSESFLEGFESGLIGQQPGKNVILKLKFPKNYPNKEYAGHKVKFVVTIYAIRENYTKDTLPDKAVKKKGKFANASEYLDDVRKKATKNKRAMWKEEYANKMWKALINKAEFKEIDTPKLEKACMDFDAVYQQYAEELDITLDQYIADYLHMDWETFQKLRQSNCEMVAKKTMLVELLAEHEGIQGDSDEEILMHLNAKLIERLEK